MAKLTEKEIEQIRKEHGIKPEHIGNRKTREAAERPSETR